MDKETGHSWILFISLVMVCESRVVKVPTGPLVHVEGQAVSIRCDVSDYEGPRDQDFEWYKVLGGDQLLNIISTFDSGFTSVQDRVNSGEITVNKLGDAAVELKFKKIRATDSGVYRCSTPSTDSVFSGNYNADVELKVIGDNLKVASGISKSMVNEGESVELQCNITRGFTEYTFVSVTWSVRRDNTLEEILTFGPDDKIKIGTNYTQHYSDGGFQLDLRGGGFYGLVLKGAKPKDEGVYVCMAQEWVRQGKEGKTWRKILGRTEEIGKVAVTPTAQSLMVAVEKNTTLNVEDTLNLTCTVAATGLPSLSLELMWLVRSFDGSGSPRVVIHIGHDGLLHNGSEAVGLSRVNAGNFRLLLRNVERSDSGLYSCCVKAWLPQGKDKWYRAAEKTSDPVQVLVTQLEPQFNVMLEARLTPQFTGDPTELRCQVTNLLHLKNGRLGVTWSYSTNKHGDAPQKKVTIASLDEHGALITGSQYQQRLERGDITVTRRELNIFILRVLQTRDADMGSYLCTTTVWTSGRQGGWEKAKDVQSTPVIVQWLPKSPVFNISIWSDTSKVVLGDTVKMKCIMSTLGVALNTGDVAFDIHWFKGSEIVVDNGGAVPLISMDRFGVVKKTDLNDNTQCSLERTDQQTFVLSVHKTQAGNVGEYYCTATPWLLTPATGAWTKGQDLTSQTIFLSIKIEFWEALKMPVSYGVVAAVIAGLLSVLLGFAVAHCCFSRNPMHIPRPRNKLIDLEMD